MVLRTLETIAAAAATALTAPTTNGKETSVQVSQTKAMHPPSKRNKQETLAYHTDHHDNKTATTIKPNK